MNISISTRGPGEFAVLTPGMQVNPLPSLFSVPLSDVVSGSSLEQLFREQIMRWPEERGQLLFLQVLVEMYFRQGYSPLPPIPRTSKDFRVVPLGNFVLASLS